jgi:hypothetical protein
MNNAGEYRAVKDPLYRYFLIGTGIFFAIIWPLYFATCKFPIDGLHEVVGRDFVNTWASARLALTGHPQSYFGFAHYNDTLHRIFGMGLFPRNWNYPPHLLLFVWPLAFLGYFPALIVWTVAGLAAYVWTGFRGVSASGRFFLLVAPAAFVNLECGQNGFFTAALLLPAIENWDRRPVLSGILFGLLSIKPQLIMLVPLVLMLTGRWRCFWWAGATVAVLFMATGLVFGFDVWTTYLNVAVPIQSNVLTHGENLMLWMMPSPFMNIRVLHLPLSVAWVVQGVISLLVLAAVVWTFRRPRDPLLSTAFLLTASLVFSPYSFNYDMIALMIVCARWIERSDCDWTDLKFILAVWLMPIVMMYVGVFGEVTGSALILLGLGNQLLKKMRAQEFALQTDGPISAMIPSTV